MPVMDGQTSIVMVPLDLLRNLDWHPGADGCWHPGDQTGG